MTPLVSSPGPTPTGVPGTVYLLCFGDGGLETRPGVFARHYLGWTEGPVEDRLARHLSGQGSPLVRAVVARLGVDAVQLVRTWTDVDRHFERALKRQRCAPLWCPSCVEHGRGRAGARSSRTARVQRPTQETRP